MINDSNPKQSTRFRGALMNRLRSLNSNTFLPLNVQMTWHGLLEGDVGSAPAEESSAPSLELSSLALAFEENSGQLDEAVDYLARGGGYSVFLTDGDAVIDLQHGDHQYVVKLDLVDANPTPSVSGENALASRSNYFVGDQQSWRIDIANYSSVRYDSVYEGVDLRYYGNQRQLEYDFIVAPDINPNVIRMNFDGVMGVEVADSGQLRLILNDAGDAIYFKAPISFQLADDGTRIDVASEYIIHADGTVGSRQSHQSYVGLLAGGLP